MAAGCPDDSRLALACHGIVIPGLHAVPAYLGARRIGADLRRVQQPDDPVAVVTAVG
jgi:hypothetical protein